LTPFSHSTLKHEQYQLLPGQAILSPWDCKEPRARPGGNITGFSSDAGPEIWGKIVELLFQAVGKLSNARVLITSPATQTPWTRAVGEAFERMNISYQLQLLQAPVNEAEYRRAFDAMRRDQVNAVVISGNVENYTHASLLGQLAQQYRIPAISNYSDSVDAGALMSYGADLKVGARRIATQIAEILNGGNPAEISLSFWKPIGN
jgi:putative tryptophan/tyrosine transport system substrate-binding protein